MTASPDDHRAATAHRLRQWRAETGRTTTARVSLRGLGELDAVLERDVSPDVAARFRAVLGDDVARRARAAYRAFLAATTPDTDTPQPPNGKNDSEASRDVAS